MVENAVVGKLVENNAVVGKVVENNEVVGKNGRKQ